MLGCIFLHRILCTGTEKSNQLVSGNACTTYEVNAEIIMMVLAMREMTAEHAENGKVAVDPDALFETLESLVK